MPWSAHPSHALKPPSHSPELTLTSFPPPPLCPNRGWRIRKKHHCEADEVSPYGTGICTFIKNNFYTVFIIVLTHIAVQAWFLIRAHRDLVLPPLPHSLRWFWVPHPNSWGGCFGGGKGSACSCMNDTVRHIDQSITLLA